MGVRDLDLKVKPEIHEPRDLDGDQVPETIAGAPATPMKSGRRKLGMRVRAVDLQCLDEMLADEGVAVMKLGLSERQHSEMQASWPVSSASGLRSPASVYSEQSQQQTPRNCRALTRVYLGKLERIVMSDRFNMIMGAFIAVNMLLMSVEMDMQPPAAASDVMITFVPYPHVSASVFNVIEGFFFVLFSTELAVRLVARRMAAVREISTYVDAAALSPFALGFFLDLEEGRHLMILRVVRLMKLSRMIRLVRLFKELNVLVKSIVSALRSLGWIGLLLLLALYCMAIVCTMLVGQNESFDDSDAQIQEYERVYGIKVDIRRYWGSTARSMTTLFQIFTLDSWTAAIRPIIETHLPWMFALFVMFIFLTSFGLLNLLMGAIVDHTMTVAHEAEAERERMLQESYKQVMLAAGRLFTHIDKDNDGQLSTKELSEFLLKHDVREVLEKDMESLNLRLDYGELAEVCQSIAEDWLDAEDITGEGDGISMEEFVGAAMRLHGPARSQDLVSTLITVKSTVLRVESIEKMLHTLHVLVEEQGRKIQDSLVQLERKIASGARNGAARVTPVPIYSVRVVDTSVDSAGSKISDRDEDASSSRTSSKEVAKEGLDQLKPSSAVQRASADESSSAADLRRSADADLSSPPQPPAEPARRTQRISLRSERKALHREGSRRLGNILRSMSQDEMFCKTETTAALSLYSNKPSTGPSSGRRQNREERRDSRQPQPRAHAHPVRAWTSPSQSCKVQPFLAPESTVLETRDEGRGRRQQEASRSRCCSCPPNVVPLD